MCTCSALFWLNAFSQTLTLPVWMRLCRSSWLGLANAFSQVSHLNTLGFWELKDGPAWWPAGGIPTLRWVARLKAFLHAGHTWMRSRPWAALLCCSSMADDVKVRPHSRHWCSRPSFSGWLPWARLAETSVTWSGSDQRLY
uniref:Secreted protein n=1 Tax=Rhinolophus ferrumequinum TaxID=59479 RepID=A0A671FSZ6_RHIFE